MYNYIERKHVAETFYMLFIPQVQSISLGSVHRVTYSSSHPSDLVTFQSQQSASNIKEDAETTKK